MVSVPSLRDNATDFSSQRNGILQGADLLSAGTPLAEWNYRDREWDQCGRQGDEIARILRMAAVGSKIDSIAQRIQGCCPELIYAIKPDQEMRETGELVPGRTPIKLQSAWFCKTKKWCPRCRHRHEMKWAQRLRKHIEEAGQEFQDGTFIHLTLTIKNVPMSDVRQALNKMNTAWDRMTKKKSWVAAGYFRSTEIKRRSNLAGPHFHALIYVPPSSSLEYRNPEYWVDLWRDALDIGYDPSVKVQILKPKRIPGGYLLTVVDQAVAVIKYGVKQPKDLIGRGMFDDQLVAG